MNGEPAPPPPEPETQAIHFHFPVEVEVRTVPAEVDPEKLGDRLLERLAGVLKRP